MEHVRVTQTSRLGAALGNARAAGPGGFYERPPISASADGLFHPASDDDIAALILLARREGRRLRVRGSSHSIRAAIRADGPRPVEVSLDRHRRAHLDDVSGLVTVEGGCHLGADPRDPSRLATWQRSLLAQLHVRGWALADLGGVTHQTVAGFLSTGSAGGSVRHAFEDSVVGIRLIDGRGRRHELRRGDRLFDAALCSMGLLGVISAVTLQCVPAYDVVGSEDVVDEKASGLFHDGGAGLEGFLRQAEYARLLWWPQAGVRRVVRWQARRLDAADTNLARDRSGALVPRRYRPFAGDVANPRLARVADLAAQWTGGLFYDALAQADGRFRRATRLIPEIGPIGDTVRESFARHVLPKVLRRFVPLGASQQFWGAAHEVLPMDNDMSERAMPTELTELWLPLERSGEVIRALRAHYDKLGHRATGSYVCELYAAKATRGLLHPANGRDSLRIDLFWFGRNWDPPDSYYRQFWELLRPFASRVHWGKHLPNQRGAAAHLRSVTPGWDDFLRARAELDPHDVFLTRYWARALGIGG